MSKLWRPLMAVLLLWLTVLAVYGLTMLAATFAPPASTPRPTTSSYGDKHS